MKVTDKLLDNARWAAMAKIIAGGLAFLVAALLAKILGKEDYGLLAMTMSVLTFARILGGSGLGQSTGKHLANLKGEEVKAKTGSYLAAGWLLQVTTALILSALIWFNNERIVGYFGSPKLEAPLKIGAVIMIFFALTEFSKACVQGLQKFNYQALITGVEFSGKLVFAVGLALIGYGLSGALVGYAVALALASLAALGVFAGTGISRPRLIWPEWRSLIGYSFPLIFTAAGFVIYTELDNIMLFYFFGAKTTGAYSLAMNMARTIPFIASPIGLAAAPLVVKLYQARDDRASELVDRLIKYIVACFFPAAVALFVLAPNLLALVGKEYVSAAPALRMMSFFVLSLSMATVAVPILNYLGKAGTRAAWMSVSVSANVLLNFLLIPRFGGVGAALATAVTHIPYMLVNVTILAREVGLRPKSILLNIAKVLAASVMAGAVAALVLFWLNSLILTVLCGAFVYIGLLVGTGMFSIGEIGEVTARVLSGLSAPVSDKQ